MDAIQNRTIVSKRQAISLGLKRYFAGLQCKKGHISERKLPSGNFIECKRREDLEYYHKLDASGRRRITSNLSKRRKFNPEARAKRRVHRNAYNKRLKQARPSWASNRVILEFYALAQSLSATTEVVHHVDHIVPIKGENVCGLHVENNLRVIPGIENSLKSNKH